MKIHPLRALGLLVIALVAMLPSLSFAQDTRTVDVRFPKGSSGTTINGSVTGYQTINYRIGVSAGQQMSVQLDTDNASNYFNITAPGASEALFNGSVSGNGTSFVIPSSGTYVVSVYLMRNAARRNETANYALTLYVQNGATKPKPVPVSPPVSAAPDAVSMQQMPAYCAGEASSRFSQRPQNLTTNMAFKSGNNYVVQGYFDANGDTHFFNCYFNLDGSFVSVN